MELKENIIKELIKFKTENSADLAKIKRRMSKKYKLPHPSNMSLLKTYHELVKNKRIKKSEETKRVLITRPIRSLSGIVNISVLTKPYPCSGKCLYCPNEKNLPKSYLSGEPAVERAKKLKFDPFLQTKKRIEMLELEGHPADKIELRIVGGTWSFYPEKYQTWFVKRCFNACNNKDGKTLKDAQKLNEKAKYRIVGMSVETRPDTINKKEIKRLRHLGVTLVELGVQTIYDDVLKLNKRGHGSKETINATKLLKNAGFKILYQVMPNLLGSDLKQDKKLFEELFSNQNFQPDLLKIYPCLLLKEAPLYRRWKAGEYQPYTEKQLFKLLKSIKKIIPYYVRIQRVSRDIPSEKIIAGPKNISNIRQKIINENKANNITCKCIRCREVRGGYDPKEKIRLFREDYSASGGKEVFLTFENNERTKLYSLLRLRIEINSAIIRELHTYGQAKSLKSKLKNSPQHKGLGKELVKKAEEIVKKEFGLNKLSVISGVGVRGYYRKLGYRLRDDYMIKFLN